MVMRPSVGVHGFLLRCSHLHQAETCFANQEGAFRYNQIDVFTSELTLGNPVAVVHGADGLSEDRMAAFVRWTNLSETTYPLEPTTTAADCRVRSFTAVNELPFAGHPALGSAHAGWIAAALPSRRGRSYENAGPEWFAYAQTVAACLLSNRHWCGAMRWMNRTSPYWRRHSTWNPKP
ncbi:PhzF family phenazine biosynthesis protein [Paeniglutamicibacter gangotriensis]|uniref:PhzF family phenazine biosynthesis protein n=1 Tax=Paeniglutamicibacter gangotriensis TaxID=254787 RepID=UPI0038990A87